MNYVNVFEVRDTLKMWGFWYTVWHHGWGNIYSIFVASQMIRYDRKKEAV